MLAATWGVVRLVARRRTGLIGLCGLSAVVLVALLGPVLLAAESGGISRNVFLPPSWSHPMGTDNLGRDILAQFVHGARVSLLVGVAAALLSATVGILMGALAGFYGGATDSLLMRLTEFFQSIPKFFLMTIIVAFVGPSLLTVALVIGLLSWPQTARITRGEFLSIKERDFVSAAHALGASDRHLLLRVILPSALPPIIVSTSLLVAHAILLETYLSFLGMGDPTRPSWGLMLSTAQQFLFQAWWMMVFPGLGIFVTVLCLNLTGDALNDALNPVFRSRSVLRSW